MPHRDTTAVISSTYYSKMRAPALETICSGQELEIPPKPEAISISGQGRHGKGKPRRVVIFALLSLVVLTQAFDTTCISVTLPIIATDLDATASESLSLGTAFLLATTIAQPLFTEFSHVVGWKPAFLSALAISIAGSITCGCAQKTDVLLTGRIIQGIGAGGPQPLAAVILTDLFPIRERAWWISFLNIPWAIGTASGPLLGGFFTQTEAIGWRWLFWLNLPPLAVSMVAAWVWLGYDKPMKSFGWRQLASVDWIGISLFVISAAALSIPLSWVSSHFPWSSLKVIIPLCFGVTGFVVLGWYETSVATKPMFRPSLFRRVSTVFQFVNITLHGILMWVTLYYLSLFYLGVKGLSPLLTGVWALPAILTVAPLAVVVGQIASRTGHYRSFLLVGWGLTIPVYFVMTLIKEETADWELILISFSLGVSLGTLVPGMSIGVQATVSNADAGHAVAMMYILRAGGQTMGVAIGQSVFCSRLNKLLEEQGIGGDDTQNLTKSMGHSLVYLKGNEEPLLEAVAQALQTVWFTSAALATVAATLAVFTSCPRLLKDNEDGAQVVNWHKPGGQTCDKPSEEGQWRGQRRRPSGIAGERIASTERRVSPSCQLEQRARAIQAN
ncbi:MFS transporter L2 [Paramyrothecium foliicola]|nr:MFS transporter L2 [Paramyrothecium foliicola]